MGAFDQHLAARLLGDAEALPWLAAQREAARAQWLGASLPTRKTESWKYTSLEPLNQHDYLNRPVAAAPAIDAAELVAGLDADRLVFVNGRFAPALSQLGHQPGVRAVSFRDANPGDRAVIEGALGQIAAGHGNPFAALNGCWLDDGVLFHVGAGVKAARPLHVVHLGVAQPAAFAHAQRLLVVLGRGAEAALIEHFASLPGEQNGFVSGTTEIRVGEAAQLRHYRLHLEEEHAIHIGGVYVELGRAALCESLVFGLGGRLKRLDLRLRHLGAGSECRLNGVYLARHSQHIDLHTSVEHEVPQGTTHQVYRGIVDDAARAVFNGRIHIHPQAQKSNADLSNRNLLLSNAAEVNTKPELEIYADDVRCSHGATVSRIDEKSLYYLLTRGIGRREAEVLLGFGFINELVRDIPIEPLGVALRAVLAGWFGRADVLQGEPS
jgi:Fe-S cluster assembly protein SufD